MSSDDDRLPELEALEQRLDDAILLTEGCVGDVLGQIRDIGWELDDYLGDYRYDMVEDSMRRFTDLIEGETTELCVLVRLAEVRLRPAQGGCLARESEPPPRLAVADLTIEKSDEDRVHLDASAAHLRGLLSYVEEPWLSAVAAAAAADSKALWHELIHLRATIAEVWCAVTIWQRYLLEQCKRNPADLGWSAGSVDSFMGWLAARG